MFQTAAPTNSTSAKSAKLARVSLEKKLATAKVHARAVETNLERAPAVATPVTSENSAKTAKRTIIKRRQENARNVIELAKSVLDLVMKSAKRSFVQKGTRRWR